MKYITGLVLLIFTSTSFAAGVCDRTSQVVKRLEETIKLPCDQITEKDLARLKVFSLHGEGLTALQINDFLGLTSLQSLELSSNNFVTLSSEPFAPLPHLEQLHLSGSNVHVFAPGFFKTLPNLFNLDLSYNPLGSLPEDTFKDSKKLKYLSLHGVPMPNYRFLRLIPQLLELGLGECDLDSLYDILTGLTSLRSLYAGSNHIQHIEAQDFKDAVSLERLNLNGNHILMVDNEAFSSLKNLRLLDLSYNYSLTWLPERAFYGLSQLEELDLSFSGLTTLPPRIFASLESLKRMDLSRNSLSALPDGVFHFLPAFEAVDLGSNNLQDLSPLIFDPRFFSEIALVRLDKNPLTTKDEMMLNDQLKDRWVW